MRSMAVPPGLAGSFPGPWSATPVPASCSRPNPGRPSVLSPPAPASPYKGTDFIAIGEPGTTMTPSRDISRLIEIMAALRTPVTGCPWDLEQTFATIAPYTIEEAYEVADAIERNDLADLRDELGDLLLQVVYYARMAEEAKAFAFPDVVEAVTTKM